MTEPAAETARALPADWTPAVCDAFWTAVNAPTYDESAAATLAFAQLLAAPATVPPPTDRAAVLREAADAVAADNHGILYGTASDYANRHADLLRRLAAEAQPTTKPELACTCGRTACESDLCDCDATPCPVDHAAAGVQDGAQQ